ncbi:murein L,D-transpeptidase catalytic domain-containing protein [Flavobacterium pedocola]
MKKIVFVSVFLITAVFGTNIFDKQKDKPISKTENSFGKAERNNIQNYVDTARTFIANNKDFNTKTAFFIDMKIPSGKNRFFIYDFSQNKVVDKGLVAHGSGSETGVEGKLKFSNTNNSYCTSLGKYSIGKSYEGKFGKAYRLYGLDKTNDNALLRNIVLHKYYQVPYPEQDQPICNSLGCPMVNEQFYSRIEKIIDTSDKKILLYIYY